MPRRSLALAFVPSLLSCLVFSQSPAKAPASAAPDYHDEAIVFEHYDLTYRYQPDGTGETTTHVLMRVQSEGAVRQFGVLSFPFASATETPHITYVRVHKHDGSTVETPPADAIDMASAVSREAPLYSDLKEKHLPVRSLSAGDTLEYELRTTIDKPEAPGQFWGAYHFTVPGSIIVLSEVITLELPKDKYVQVWSPNHKPEISDRDNLHIYQWKTAQLTPAPRPTQDAKSKPKPPKDPDEDADGRKLPSIAWTTFHTWAEVGDWYRTLAANRAEPTDAIKARAAEITKDAKTPDDQLRTIYQFVSEHTRYVGIDFGVGRYQPHLASEVLANQYGDCKDKDTLLESLLRAKGFKTSPALIGAGITPIPDFPSPATFNHVITTVNLPEGRIWLDSTPETTPYRYLIATLRDQHALIIPSDAPATLEKTPAQPPYPLESHFQAAGILDGDGKFTAKITATYRTDDEAFIRGLARGVAPAEWDKASQYISANTGFGGTTSETRFPAPDDIAKPIEIDYTYNRHPYGNWDSHQIIPPFPALDISLLDEDDGQPETDIQLGAPRTLYATATMQLPDGYTTDLPDPIHVKTAFALLDQTYRFDGHKITVDRKFVVLQKKLPKEQWKQYIAFTKDAHLDSVPWIQLVPHSHDNVITLNPKPGPMTAASKPIQNKDGSKSVTLNVAPAIPASGSASSGAPPAKADSTASPSEEEADDADVLMRKAQVFMRSSDWDNAQSILEEVKEQNPNERYLWASLGFIASFHNDHAEARADYQKELDAYPDSPLVVVALADLENKDNDWSTARKTLGAWVNQHPDNIAVAIQFATMESAHDDNDGALHTLQNAAKHAAPNAPETRGIQLSISQALLRANRPDEAAASAKSLLDTDDPGILNNAAYILADAGISLSEAEAASRKSIAALEEKSTVITAAEANENAFLQSHLLIASWDTLGWTLFREGKLDDAKPYLVAAWRNGLRPEVGDHLGQLYEAEHKTVEAYETYDQAANSLDQKNLAPAIKHHLDESAARLRPSAPKATHFGRVGLQESRTYKLTGMKDLTGWGTFRLEITAAGVIESLQASGEPKLASLTKTLDTMHFPELVPSNSKAHLLRSGVLSCSANAKCELVLVPDGDLRTERY